MPGSKDQVTPPDIEMLNRVWSSAEVIMLVAQNMTAALKEEIQGGFNATLSTLHPVTIEAINSALLGYRVGDQVDSDESGATYQLLFKYRGGIAGEIRLSI